MTLSRQTLELCLDLVKRTTLDGQADDFEEVAEKVLAARRELMAALAVEPDPL